MKKVSTRAGAQSGNISQQKLTIGLDLGDGNRWYCLVDEAGQIWLEQRVRTNAKALREVFGEIPHSRIALEIGTHSPWISRLLSELGHEVIVANARKVYSASALNDNHNKDLKNLFKSAAISASTRSGPLRDFYMARVEKGIRPDHGASDPGTQDSRHHLNDVEERSAFRSTKFASTKAATDLGQRSFVFLIRAVAAIPGRQRSRVWHKSLAPDRIP
jgi:hypothetical protein